MDIITQLLKSDPKFLIQRDPKLIQLNLFHNTRRLDRNVAIPCTHTYLNSEDGQAIPEKKKTTRQ